MLLSAVQELINDYRSVWYPLMLAGWEKIDFFSHHYLCGLLQTQVQRSPQKNTVDIT